MAKPIIKSLIAVSAIAIVGLAVAGPGRAAPSAEDDIRSLLLSASGTRTVKAGQIRIPVPVDGVEYEVVVTKPGEPKVVPVTR